MVNAADPKRARIAEILEVNETFEKWKKKKAMKMLFLSAQSRL